MKITSRKNQKTALYRELLKDRNVREEKGLFVADGKKLCEEALGAGLKPVSAIFTNIAMNKYKDLYDNLNKTLPAEAIDEINEDLSRYISDTKSPQGVFAVFRVLDKTADFDKIYKCTRIVLLDRIQDPGNFGAIIRSCDAFGIDALIASCDTVDIYSPKVLRSAAGSVFRLPVYTADLSETAEFLKRSGFSCYAAILNNGAKKLGEITFSGKTAIIIGNEGNGVNNELAALCEGLYIPIKNAESLNASVAASIIIYELSKE